MLGWLIKLALEGEHLLFISRIIVVKIFLWIFFLSPVGLYRWAECCFVYWPVTSDHNDRKYILSPYRTQGGLSSSTRATVGLGGWMWTLNILYSVIDPIFVAIRYEHNNIKDCWAGLQQICDSVTKTFLSMVHYFVQQNCSLSMQSLLECGLNGWKKLVWQRFKQDIIDT